MADYLPAMRTYEAKDPSQWAPTSDFTEEQRQQFLGLLKRYMEAATPAEAVEIWRNASEPFGGKNILDALQIRQELG